MSELIHLDFVLPIAFVDYICTSLKITSFQKCSDKCNLGTMTLFAWIVLELKH